MRVPIAIFILACGFAASCPAQQPGSRLATIMNPDMTLAYPDQTRKYDGGGGSVKIRAYDLDKHAYDTKSAEIKSFDGTHSFLGIKNPWFGSKVYATEAAYLPHDKIIENANHKFEVKEKEVNAYDTSGKIAGNKQPFFTQPFVIPHTSQQKALDEISAKMEKKLTIDDVRELLNKSH